MDLSASSASMGRSKSYVNYLPVVSWICADTCIESPSKQPSKCPLHFRPSELKPIGSRPEDFSATIPQQTASAEILRRSVQNDWADLDVKSETKKRRE